MIRPQESDDAGRKIHIPRDVTLKDLWDATPARVVRALVSSLVVVFVAGVSVGGWVDFGRWINPPNGKGSAAISPKSNAPTLESNAPTPEQVPAKNTALLELRSRNGVERIDKLQNELTSDRIPNGRFGFVGAYAVGNYVRDGSYPEVDFDGISQQFEIHKLIDGKVVLVGYVSEADAIALADPTRARRKFDVFSKQHSGTQPVPIELNKIGNFSYRQLPDFDGTIAEVTLKDVQ